MENTEKKMPWNTKLGFITGPLMICMGIYLLREQNKSLAYVFIGLGIARLAMTAWLFWNHPNRKN
jgi:hypothetical protein